MPGMTEIKIGIAIAQSYPLVELKIDGARHTWDGNGLFSDRNIDRSLDRFPHIAEELRTVNWKVRGEVAIPGGNVLQLNKKENWHKAKFYIFDLYELYGEDCTGLTITEKRRKLEGLMHEGNILNLKHVTIPPKFESVSEGWEYVEANEAEGLVVKNQQGVCWKVKKLREDKLLITGFVPGKTKGAFTIQCGDVTGKVSGTSTGFVDAYRYLKDEGKEVYAEIEYAFLTDYGTPFQPRLRRVGTWEDLRITT
jgi:hypothetical protein